MQPRPRGELKMINEKRYAWQTPLRSAVLRQLAGDFDILHEDVAAMECLALILGQGTARLVRSYDWKSWW